MSSLLREAKDKGDSVSDVDESAQSRRVCQVSLGASELLETCTAGLDGELHQLTREVQLDGGLNLFRAQGLPLGEDHEVPRLLHDLDEELGKDVVDHHHALLGDAQLRFHFLHHSEDVGLERGVVKDALRP